jgi:signal transduction histidine kinase
VDLGSEQRIDEVRLFPAHPPEFAHRPGFGYPPALKVEASNDPEFHEAVELIGFRGVNKPALQDHVNPGDNMMTFTADGEPARYIRITAQRFFDSNGKFFFAFSELQALAKGENVALHKSVTAFDTLEGEGWSMASLVDGYTSRANILDWREWLSGLSRRRETMQQIALLKQERITVIHQLQSMAWAALAGLVLLAVIALFLQLMRLRKKRQQEMEALRQRISQDLHDEIGSSLGSIALISQDVIASGGNAAQVRSDLLEIQDIARETVDAMRDIVRLVQSDRYGQGNLIAHLRETACRALRGVSHTLTVEAEEAFNRLPMDQQRDVILMFKEVLHNITRHAEATQVEIKLTGDHGELILAIQDNGRGFDPASTSGDGMGLVNLRRRAAKIDGKIELTSAPASGTSLTITLTAP